MSICVSDLFNQLIVATPLDALSVKGNSSGFNLNVVLDDYDLTLVQNQAGVSEVCLVFVNSDSGEATSDVDGNYGDRNNLTVSSMDVKS